MTKQAWIFIYVALGLFIVGGATVGFLTVGSLEHRAKPGGVAFGILAPETVSDVVVDGEPVAAILHWEFDDHPDFYRYGPIHRRPGTVSLSWREGDDSFTATVALPPQMPFDHMLTINLIDENRRRADGIEPALHSNGYAISGHEDMKVLEIHKGGELVFDQEAKQRRTEELMRQRIRFSPR
ncbi:MAG: hypothetical protein ACK4P3_03405 [Fimbriimonadaceae bacterium]